MLILEAGIDDIWIIQSLAERIWEKTYKTIITADQISYMMEMMYSTSSLEKQMNEEGQYYLLAKDGDEYIGYLSYEMNYDEEPFIKIQKIYVLSSAQGKGIGTLLIDEVLKTAKANKADRIKLNVNRDNNRAINFYKRNGFNIEKEEDNDIGNGFFMTDYVMTKLL